MEMFTNIRFNKHYSHGWIILLLIHVLSYLSITCHPQTNSSAATVPEFRVSNITVLSVTNTTVTLEWPIPKVNEHDVIRAYHIYYFMEKEFVQEHANLNNVNLYDERPINYTVHDNMFQLSQLHSYRNYTITITACKRRECSQPSFPIRVMTAVGYPGIIDEPEIVYSPRENNFIIDVSWQKPNPTSGPIDYYEIIGAHYKGPTRLPSNYSHFTPRFIYAPEILKNPDHFYFKTNLTKWTIENVPVPVCNDHENIHAYTTSYITIRAINNNPFDTAVPYYGPWSDPELLTTRCTVGFDGFTCDLGLTNIIT